uniref:Uncharacterized protein n=1 Tax=Zea mays TaxID=4577 RepID=C4J246_MAIZE|nr:unknown [Zea mays]
MFYRMFYVTYRKIRQNADDLDNCHSNAEALKPGRYLNPLSTQHNHRYTSEETPSPFVITHTQG